MTWVLPFLATSLLQNICCFWFFSKYLVLDVFCIWCYIFLILHLWMKVSVIIMSEKCVEHIEGIWSQKYYLEPNSLSAKSACQISSVNVDIKTIFENFLIIALGSSLARIFFIFDHKVIDSLIIEERSTDVDVS